MNDFETTKQVSPLTNSELERDIVERLRDAGTDCDWNGVDGGIQKDPLLHEAADEITRLRAALSTEAQPEVTGAVARVDDLERGGRVRALALGLGLDTPLYTALPDAGFAAGMMKAAELAYGLLRNSLLNKSAESVRSTILSAIPADSKAALRDTAIVDYLESLGQGFRVTVDLDAAYNGERKIRLSVNRGGVNDPGLELVAEGSSLRAIVNSALEGKS